LSDLFGLPVTPAMPAGLRHTEDLIPPPVADALVERFRALPFRAFDFHGFKGLRRVVSYGRRYDFAAARLEHTQALPGFLRPLREAAAAFAEVDPAVLEHALVTEYAPGAPIGWHRDRPEFGKVIGVSFVSPSVLRFRRRAGDRWERFGLTLQPRSAYLLDGEARRVWEHSIAPAPALRYSVTFRTLRPTSA
jgi:alkylated DNA repair dioxygenase AlkB